MSVLGIESSCDEAGVTLYSIERGLLAHHLHTQMAIHARYGNVVPESASCSHTHRVVSLTQGRLKEAGVGYADIDAVASMQGPGLDGVLLTGSGFANALAFTIGRPIIPVHHFKGHLLLPLLTDDKPEFPFVVSLASGECMQFIAVRGIGGYILLDESVDDTVGEAFDKTVKLLRLLYPGGAKLSELAKLGTPDAFTFPRPTLHSYDLQIGLSGLKTAVLTTVKKVRVETGCDKIPEQTCNDICRVFQNAAIDVLAAKVREALLDTGFKTLVVVGGVGTSQELRDKSSRLAAKVPFERGKPKPQGEKINVYLPPIVYCTDNGAMIASASAVRPAERQAVGVFDVKLRQPLSDIVKQG